MLLVLGIQQLDKTGKVPLFRNLTFYVGYRPSKASKSIKHAQIVVDWDSIPRNKQSAR